MRIITLVCVLLSLTAAATAWDSEELEIFDLVEDINENFYTMLGIEQSATLAEVKRAFRNLSVILHPDKNDAEDANIKFRNLVFVYEVLKDSSKREKYDNVLKNGLPNWKSALYYYRRVHKMGLAEMSAILFTIITVGQYIIAWAAYAEKKYTAESIIGSRLKRMQRKNKASVDIETLLSEIPTPSIYNTLPFQIPRTIWNTPKAIKGMFDSYSEYKEEQQAIVRQEAEEAEHQKFLEEEYVREKEAKKEGIRRRKEKYAVKEKTDEELKGYAKLDPKGGNRTAMKAVNAKDAIAAGGFWTDDDLVELVRLVKKYPGGTPARWEVIAEMMNRSVHEITFMAAKMKENGYRVPGQTDSVAENIIADASKKIKTKTTDSQILIPETNWSQEQQKLLELAIVKYPKSTAGDRWVKIANTIPGKTKEECLARYKHLVEIVKARARETQALEATTTDDLASKTDEEELTAAEIIAPVTPTPTATNKGKPRNKRKDRKNRMDFSSDEEEYDD